MIIDTHTHLYDEKFDTDRDEMIAAAIEKGVQKMLMPNCDSGTITAMLEVENKFPGQCLAMMGLHPCYVKENVQDELDIVSDWLTKRKFCAIGEIGLDYYWDKSFVPAQHMAFRTQIEWSLQYQLPIVIHTRDAIRDTIDIVKEYAPKGARGVFHCFSGSYESAVEIIDLGFYLGIGGVLTYKNAGLQEVIRKIDLAHIILETDAPYLTPVPFRGKRNESGYILNIAEKMAELKGMDVETISEITTANAVRLFQLLL